jgi:hypothetical protein
VSGIGWLGYRLANRRSIVIPLAAICVALVLPIWLSKVWWFLTTPYCSGVGFALVYAVPVAVLLLIAARRDGRVSRRSFAISVAAVCSAAVLLVVPPVLVAVSVGPRPSAGHDSLVTVVAMESAVGLLGILAYWAGVRAGACSATRAPQPRLVGSGRETAD